MEDNVTKTDKGTTTKCDNIIQNSNDKNKKDSSINDGSSETQEDLKNESEDDIVFIQDLGFSITISAPGLEPFDIHVSPQELVQEIHQLLMDREDTCHRTCFSLQLEGNTLDNFAELKNIPGLQEKSLVKVIEELYTIREARIHVRHVRDLLKSLDSADAYNGLECSSLSFLHTITGGDISEKRKNRLESVDCTPPDYIVPGTKERTLLPLHPVSRDHKSPHCLKVLTTSGWNPPPGSRKMHGDLIYLYVITVEDKRFHITGSTRGFFVNLSSDDEFNPKSANSKQLYHSLIELLNQISPGFKRNFANLQKKRILRHPFERVVTPYQIFSWAAPIIDHTIDAIRAEDAFSSKLGYEEHIPGQTRDWNEELQTTRELPRKNLPERLLRERAIFKVHSDFVSASVRGAMAVVDGNVMAINPGEESKMQMFIWNNIFFSLGFDVRDHYKDVGGDAAAYIAPVNDLQGVRAFSQVDLEGLYTLGTVVIDYRGYRITAQSIIPGILEREQDQSVVYGSVDFGKTVVTHSKYLELLKKAGQQLKILPHKVLNEKNEEIELCSSVECKGIIGNDSRYYILDLLRTFPPDLNFLPVGLELSKEAQAMHFPKEHKHKLCCLRQELIEAFVETRYVMFIKHAAYHLQQLGEKKISKENQDVEPKSLDIKESAQVLCNGSDNELEDKTGASAMKADEAKKIMESFKDKEEELEDGTKEIVRKAAQAVCSLKDNEFYISFNPDAFSPGVRFPETQSEQLKKEQKLIQDASDFLLTIQIPAFVKDFFDHSASPLEGWSLTEAMHNRGINMRYLGKVTEMLAKFTHLDYAHSIAVTELVCRSAKHLFKMYLQGVDMMYLSAAICHFLNCFLGNCPNPHVSVALEELQIRNNKKRGKRKNKSGILAFQGNTEWATFTPRSLWSDITAELLSYYDYKIECDSIEMLVEKFNLQKISLLRQFCIKIGVQIMLKEYNCDTRHRQTFIEEDIINIFPVVKHINPRASDAVNFYSAGQAKIQQGAFREGFELITEALNLLNNVYGAMHPEIVQCLRMLARLNYIMGDNAEALQYQEKAVLMSERVNGIDHPNTIIEYTHLALYCFANSQVSTALKLLYRARYLILLVYGEIHPEIALLDSNIGLILHAVGEYDLSLRFLEKALQLNIRFYGSKSLKVAVSYHLVAQTQSCTGDFRSALQNEKETFAIYKQQLGEEHEKTQESSECLKHLTQQAVVLQKKMNEICKGTGIALFPPIQIQTPSIATVLDMLNIVNGILFVQISQQDIDEFRLEVERRQQQKKIELETKPVINGNINGLDKMTAN